jgi:hypothetical protein
LDAKCLVKRCAVRAVGVSQQADQSSGLRDRGPDLSFVDWSDAGLRALPFRHGCFGLVHLCLDLTSCSGGEGRVHAGTYRSEQPIEFDLQAAQLVTGLCDF